MSSAAARDYQRKRRTEIVEEFCSDYFFRLESLNHGYQLRIEGIMDVYPTNGKWHWIETGARGDWDRYIDLRDIMLRHLGKQEVKIPEFDYYRLASLASSGNLPPITISLDSETPPKRKWWQIWKRK